MKLTKLLPDSVVGLLAGLIAAQTANAVIQVVSKAEPANPRDTGIALGSAISGDGSTVLFHAAALGQHTGIYVQALPNGTAKLVSANTNGVPGNRDCFAADFSPDGRWVAFESEASDLVPGDTNDALDVFLRDTLNQQTCLISAGTNNFSGNKLSHSPAITPDGHFVTFVSEATDLTPDDTNAIPDIFLRDVQTGSMVVVSVGAINRAGYQSASSTPVISTNGQIIAFASSANGLVPGLVLNSSQQYPQVYVRDLLAGTNRLASMDRFAGYPAQSGQPALSGDGRFVSFHSAAGNNPQYPVLRRDLQTGALEQVTTNAGLPELFAPVMTPDGRFISYTVAPASGSVRQVYCWDGLSGTNELISVNTNGLSGANHSDTPALSADGRLVTFLSRSPDLITNKISGVQVFLRDRQLQTNYLISADLNGLGTGDLANAIPGLSADGQTVVFDSISDSFVGGTSTCSFDVFARNVDANTTEKLTGGNTYTALTASAASFMAPGCSSADGRYLVFSSLADNLVSGDTNATYDVFLNDTATGTMSLVSQSTNGHPANGQSLSPSLSPDGRFVAFLSRASNLTSTPVNNTGYHLFVFDAQSSSKRLVDVICIGTNEFGAGGSPVLQFSMCANGTHLAFSTKALLPSSGVGSLVELYIRDLTTGKTTRIPRDLPELLSVSLGNPVISPDGLKVAFGSPSASFLYQTNTVTSIGQTNIGLAAFSGDSRWMASLRQPSPGTLGLFLHDTAMGTNKMLHLGSSTITPTGALSLNQDGRFIIFSTDATLIAADTNQVNDVFLYDRLTGTLTLVSANHAGTAAANGLSDTPSISDDGRYVTFRSRASDLVVNDANHMSDVFLYDRITGQITLVSQPLAGAGSANHFSSYPFISADGSRISFTSFANDLVDNDLNLATDVFVYDVPTAVPADSDHDGMEDAWERDQFGDLSHDGLADGDGDGATDVEEFLAGTVPTNPASRFECLASAQAPGEMQLSWPAAPGRSYQVQFRSSLDETQWQVLPGQVTVVGNQGVLTDTNAMGQRFYRAVLIP